MGEPGTVLDQAATGLIRRHDTNLQTFLRAQGDSPLGQVTRQGDCELVFNGLPGGGRLLAPCPAALDLPAVVARADAWFAPRSGSWQWVVCPGQAPELPAPELAALGLVEQACFPVLGLDLASWKPEPLALPDKLHLERVGSRELLEVWVTVAACAYPFGGAARPAALAMLQALMDRSDMDLWLLLDGPVPVTTAATCRTGADLGMYWAATPPEYRGRGYATAFVLGMIQLAHESTTGTLFTQNTLASQGICRRAGFRELAGIRIHQTRNPQKTAGSPAAQSPSADRQEETK